jgi:phosphoserine phosphatase RsbU/P
MKERSFNVQVPVDARFLRAVRNFFQPLLEQEVGAAEAGRIVLALDEACSNVVRHCRPEREKRLIAVEAVFGSELLRFRVRDFCGAEDVEKIRPRALDDVRPGGLGTHFIKEIMDRVSFEAEPDKPGRMALVLERARARGDGAGS